MAWRKPSNIREGLEILLRHQKKFFFTTALIAILTVVVSLRLPRKYTAAAVLEMRRDLAISLVGSKTTEKAADPIRKLRRQELTNRSAIRQVIDDLGLTENLPHTIDGELTAAGQIALNDMIKKISRNISVKYLARYRDIERVRVAYTDQDRELVPKMTNRLVENYVQKASDMFDQKLILAKKFFDMQAARYRQKLHTAEFELIRFRSDYPGLDPNDPGSVDSTLVDLNARLDRTEEQINILRQKRKALQLMVDQQPEMIERRIDRLNPELEHLIERKQRLEDALFELQHAGGRASERHPRVIKLRRQIAQIEQQIATTEASVSYEGEKVPNIQRIQWIAEIKQMGAELEALEDQQSVLSRRIQEYEIRKRNYVELRNQYVTMKRDIADYRKQTYTWENEARRTQTALDAAISGRSISMTVIERPEEYSLPSYPTMPKVLLAALALGIGAGAMMIVLAEMIDRSFHGVQHAVDDLKLPVLGAVNEIVTPADLFRRKIFGWGIYPATAAAMVIVLIVTIYLASLSLADPSSYERLMRQPVTHLLQSR